MRPHIQIRQYCYACRRRYHHPRGHMREWEYIVRINGVCVLRRQTFKTYERAAKSAQRAYDKLLVALELEEE